MAKLDKLIENLKEDEIFLLEANKEPMVQSGHGEPTPILNQSLTGQQILGLLLEVAPDTTKIQLEMDGNATFDYSIGSMNFDFSITAAGNAVKARITPRMTQKISEPAPLIKLGGEEESFIPAPPPAKEEAALENNTVNIFDSPEAEMNLAEEEAVAPEPDIKVVPPKPKVVIPLSDIGGPKINALFHRMISDGASDLHISSNCKPMLRISGDLMEIPEEEEITPERMKELLNDIMPEENKTEFENLNDTDFPYEIEGLSRFRANVFRDRMGVGAVFRQIPFEILTSEQLGLSKGILDLCFMNKGLVLVTGPTGSGKSTTLAALIDYINRYRKQHIITIEDPIEFVHPNKNCLINQREIGTHTNSYASALRAALREDPDIVLVGEMRDLETISIALETAETGHLVFGTLHTSTAASTVDRIIDQFPADRQDQIRTMLSGSLRGVVAQTLCKKKGGGRVAALEVMLVNAAVSNLIREGKVFQIPSIIQTSRGQGMELLNDALVKLVVDGLVEPEEAFMKAIDKGGLITLMKSKGITMSSEESTN